MSAPQIKSRKPTGRPPWPLVLLEGEEKAGKSWQLYMLSTSDKVGMTYALDMGEGAADEYGAIAGANYEVLIHDGTYQSILEQITAVYNEARRALDAGEKPVVLGIDSMSALWGMLVDWTVDRARRSKKGQATLQADPDAEVDIPMNLWNDANGRHLRIMNLLMSFPGIVVMTARAKWTTEVGGNGQPVKNGAKVYKVVAQKDLAYDATVWIRMYRTPRRAEIIGGRGLALGTHDGEPIPLPDFTLEDLVFNRMKAGTAETITRELPALAGDIVDALFKQITDIDDEQELRDLWMDASPQLTPDDRAMFSEGITMRLGVLRAHQADAENPVPPVFPEDAPLTQQEKLRRAAQDRRDRNDAAEQQGGNTMDTGR
jgi:hypothetical protein